MKKMEALKNQEGEMETEKRDIIVREILIVKILLDLKIAVLRHQESPKFKVLVRKTLPLALELHKEILDSNLTTLINKEL